MILMYADSKCKQALALYGDDIAIAFSGAEDVALIEYAKLTGRPFRVFSLDTGRLNSETYEYFHEVSLGGDAFTFLLDQSCDFVPNFSPLFSLTPSPTRSRSTMESTSR